MKKIMIIAAIAALMASCSKHGNKNCGPGVLVITEIEAFSDRTDVVKYGYEQRGMDWTYSGVFFDRPGAFKMYDSVRVGVAERPAPAEPKSE